MCEPQTASENVWHVLDVLEGSPAESAGLVPMGDWILGVCNLGQVSRLLIFGQVGREAS
jgi:C-terminal processing protease CtpA/Prc